jgi:hypothetical protein
VRWKFYKLKTRKKYEVKNMNEFFVVLILSAKDEFFRWKMKFCASVPRGGKLMRENLEINLNFYELFISFHALGKSWRFMRSLGKYFKFF